MTYNFDPDKWYENEILALRAKRRAAKLTDLEYESALETLAQQHKKMWERLDGSYQIPRDGHHKS